MRADRRSAVRIGTSQREVEPPVNIVMAPTLLSIRMGGIQGGDELTVGIPGARPNMALVEVGMEVDQARPNLPAVEIDAAHQGSGRGDAVNDAVRDRDVDDHKAFAIDR